MSRIIAIATLAAALSSRAAAQATQLKLVMLNDSAASGAMCLDGSPYGFYYSPGSGEGASQWLLFFHGGGWCYDAADCYERSKTTLGSSLQWSPTDSLAGIGGANCSNTPFCDWNHVHMAYCDGASFSGSRVDPVVYNGTNLWFRGRANIDAVINALLADVVHAPIPFANAGRVVLSGSSAGGLATFLHADYVGSVIPARVRSSYVAVPVSGFFLDAASVAGPHVYTDQIKSIHALSNASFGVNDACVQANPGTESWRCFMAQYTLPFITTPLFILNSIYDSWQTSCVLTAEPVQPGSSANGNCSAAPGWRECAKNPENCTNAQMVQYNDFRTQFGVINSSLSVTGSGAFLHSCHTHVEAINANYWYEFKVQGVAMYEAFTRWWNGEPSARRLYFDCEYHADTEPRSCNPSCGSQAVGAGGTNWAL